MAVKKQLIFNIDKKRQCYKMPMGLFDEFSKFATNKYLYYDNFKLHIIDDGRGEDSEKEPIRIKANVILADGTLLGDFVFCNSAQFDGLCFFTFDNAALYKTTNIMDGEKFNYMSYIEPIAETLDLVLNNYTIIELAADVNFNIIPRIMKFITDYENYDMIINGKKVIDENRHIENFGEFYGRTRAKRDKYPTLYFKQSNTDGLQLKIYDKSKEIVEDNPQKKYVEEWNNFGNRKTYRLELTIRNDYYKKWLDSVRTGDAGVLREWGDFERSESLQQLQAYKCPLWAFGANRLVYFRSKRTSEVVSLLDIANGATA